MRTIIANYEPTYTNRTDGVHIDDLLSGSSAVKNSLFFLSPSWTGLAKGVEIKTRSPTKLASVIVYFSMPI